MGISNSLNVRAFTQMVSCHHEEALNYKFKHKRANKYFSDADRVDQWFTAAKYQINQIAIKTDYGVPIFSLTMEVDMESANRTYIASILNIHKKLL